MVKDGHSEEVLYYNTILELMLFLHREQKWDEVMCADMFVWQKECGINITWSLIMALEKDGKKTET